MDLSTPGNNMNSSKYLDIGTYVQHVQWEVIYIQ